MASAAALPQADFDLTFRPPPPLSVRGAKIVVGLTAFVMVFAALRFLLIGAWIVAPFLLVDLALLVWAFRLSRRNAKASERLRLAGGELLIERTDPKGEQVRWRVPRGWTRVELESHAPQDRLWVKHRQKRLLVGKHLNRRERHEVYKVMARALNGAA